MGENLVRRGIILVDRCSTCKCSGKTVDYLLLHCAVAHELWSFVFSVYRVHRVKPIKVVDLMFCWRNWFGKHGGSFVWNISPLYLMLVVLRERNGRTFNRVEVLIIELKPLFLRSLFEWFRVLRSSETHSILEFIDSLFQIVISYTVIL